MDYKDAKTQVEKLFEVEDTGLSDTFKKMIGPVSRSRIQGGLYAQKPSFYEDMRDTYVQALLLREHANALVASLRPAVQEELTGMQIMQSNTVLDQHGSPKSDQDSFVVGASYAHRILQELEKDVAKRSRPSAPQLV